MIAHINIGSNLGNRTELIGRAVSLLDERVGRVLAVSHPFESEAWGYKSENPYVNVGVNVEVDENVNANVEVVGQLLEIEQSVWPGVAHRTAAGEYADRAIDLDLICIGNMVSDNAEATVPHPRMHLREFVLLPMVEILPDWVHPRLGLTAAKILAQLRNKT